MSIADSQKSQIFLETIVKPSLYRKESRSPLRYGIKIRILNTICMLIC